MEEIVMDSTWIPEEYSIESPCGMNVEIYAKMAGPSAKNISYGIHGIHMELAWIPPGMWGQSKDLNYFVNACPHL